MQPLELVCRSGVKHKRLSFRLPESSTSGLFSDDVDMTTVNLKTPVKCCLQRITQTSASVKRERRSQLDGSSNITQGEVLS